MSKHLEEIGFVRGAGHPSVPSWWLVTFVHGDDYTLACEPAELRWFTKKLEEAYKIRTQIIDLRARAWARC